MKYLFTSILVTVIFMLSGCSNKQIAITHKIDKNAKYYSLQTVQSLNEKELIQALRPYKIIMIGDHHTEDNLHKTIASLIKSISEDGYKVVLANEWFYPSDLEVLQKFEKKDINASEFQKEIEWSNRFKRHKYESFAPIYEAVRNNNGKLYGINISKKSRKKISDQNLSAMSEEELSFNNSLDISVQPHRDLVLPFLSHCHAPKIGESQKECSERMYKVQVAWDSAMANESYKLSKSLNENEKLIVFAGSMHIENRLGIPLRFARQSDARVATIIPSQTREVTNGLGDFIMFYEEVLEK